MRPLTLAVLALLVASPGAAAERTMAWRALEVEARLDAAGDLHVRERQEIRFDGAWNGGERRFRLGPGQRLRFERLLRETPRGTVEVLPGDLGTVDRYALADGTTLRWRARAASAPPFAGAVLPYVLEYTLQRVLVRDADGGILLAHDLAFPDRDWPIERARGQITLDPAWQAEDGAALAAEGADLPPGTGLVVRARLRWAGAGRAPEVTVAAPVDPMDAEPEPPPAPGEPLPPEVEVALAAGFALALLAVAVAVFRHAGRQGQLAPAPGLDAVDERFVAEHLLAWPPEVVATAWHGRVGEAAVAATVARLCAARMIEAHAEGKTLRMKLLADRSRFQGSDETLVRKLFPEGDTIDTDRLRAHYQGSGFDPADSIRGQTEHRLRNVDGPLARQRRWPRLAAGVLVALAAALGLLAAFVQPPVSDPFEYFIAALVAPVAQALAALAVAAWFARAIRRPWLPAALLALLLVRWAVALVLRSREVGGGETVWGLGAGVLAWAGAALGVFAFGRTRRLPDAILFRKRIAAARAWLARELASPAPRLKDAWAPWLVGLGLSSQIDRWFTAHPRASPGPEAADDRERFRSSSTEPAPERWTGGGGLFSGGGASGSWAALGAVAASYAAPSSSSSSDSSSSSSSSSDSSSGGGGGGGW